MPGPTFWGLCFVSGIMIAFALPGAVPVVGGSSDPLLLRSPGVSPQKGKVAHGPRHPSVTIRLSLCLIGVWFLPVRCFRHTCLVRVCGIFWSLGLECCLVWCPLRPDPCQPRCLLSPLALSLVCVGYFRRRRSLSFSFSQVLGKPKFWGVWDSPCVSPTWPRTTSSTRTPCSTSSPRFRLRTWFFSPSSFADLVVVGLGLLGLCLFGGCSGCGCFFSSIA